MKKQREKLIIDCDPGVDDALAIYLAKQSGCFDILALTSVFGNNSIEISTRNASYLQSEFGLVDTVIARGAASPIQQLDRTPGFSHRKNGLRDIEINHEIPQKIPNAAETMANLLKLYPNQITIVAIGPLRNIAELILKEPVAARLTKQYVVMGGSFWSPGNITAKAEANFYNDPLSAHIVLTSGLPARVIGLDVTRKPRFYAEDILPILAHMDTDSFLYRLLYKIFIADRSTELDTTGTAFHDPFTIAWLLYPDLISFRPRSVQIETIQGALCEGACIVDDRRYVPAANVLAAENANVTQYKQLLLDVLENRPIATASGG